MLKSKALKNKKLTNYSGSLVKILHLSHTNISRDSRILKEIKALNEISYFELSGIGILDCQGYRNKNSLPQVKIISLNLFFRKLRFLPGVFRYLFVGIELIIRIFLNSFKFRPNVVHCHDTPVLLVGLLIKFVLGAKLVYDAHELESNKNGQAKIISWLTLLVERFCWPFVDYFISVSPSIIKWYNAHLGYKPNSLILNSPCTDEFSKLKKPNFKQTRYFHKKFGIPRNVKVFLYIGLLVPGRGIDKMLSVFSSSSVKSHIVFMGHGPLSERISSALETCGRIHMHRQVQPQEVISFSKAADFGLCLIENVSLSDYYCLPNKLFEYAFAGVPILASNFPDISEIINSYKLGECCDLDTDSIIYAIKRIENTKPRLFSNKLNSISWQNQSKSLKKAYHRLLGI
jgi:glycosyltransferase involved in cell wall biosynthesis